jgi:proteasome accessory factor B
LEALSDALLRQKKVTFTYHGIERNQTTEREVRPYGLLFKHSHWYLVGWDETRDAQRTFRVDRMEGVQVNPSAPGTPDYDMPAEPVLEAYRDRKAWELGEGEEKVEALVRFRFPTSLWAARNGYGTEVEESEDGSALRRFEVRQPDPFLRWILSLQGDAVIESPPALREAFGTLVKQVADLYREDAGG